MSAGRGWATAGFLLGISLSVAANVAHARQEVGPQLAGAAFPIVLLVTVEILSRVSWPGTWGWGAARYGGAGVVAMVAAIVSYRHMSGLLRGYGEDPVTAAIGPLAIDGLMVVASMALLAIGKQAHPESVPADAPTMAVERADEAGVPEPVPAVLGAVPDAPAVPDELDEVHLRAAREFADEVTSGRVPGLRAIKQTLRIGQPKARQVQAYLSALATGEAS